MTGAPAMAASSISLRADTGETFLKVTWGSGYTVNIYVDGEVVTEHYNNTIRPFNSTLGYYYLTQLKANEEHRIEVVNVSDTTDRKSVTLRTLPPATMVQILFIISLIIAVLILFMTDPMKILFTGLLNSVLTWYGRAIAYNYYGIEWVFLGIMVFSGAVVVYALYEISKEALQWW